MENPVIKRQGFTCGACLTASEILLRAKSVYRMHGDRTLVYTGRRVPYPCDTHPPGAPHGGGSHRARVRENKKEQLGPGWRVAEAGLLACVIDLRGHGEHSFPLDELAGSEIDAAIRYCRSFGNVTAIGHSLGGRLALLSDADFCIATHSWPDVRGADPGDAQDPAELPGATVGSCNPARNTGAPSGPGPGPDQGKYADPLCRTGRSRNS